MRCAVCEELHDENTLACQAEAIASLQQRYLTMLHPQREAAASCEHRELHEIILFSRMRQLKIASRREGHRAVAHTA